MKRHKHSLSHTKLLTFDQGELVPIGCYEVLPGDTVQQATSALVRVSPLVAPVMHPVRVRIHHWFVPTRLIWDDFEKFITGGPDGLDASVPPTITFSAGLPDIGTLPDYMGVPTDIAGGIVASALPFRAYDFIWNEYYRDQDLQTLIPISKASGNDVTTGWDLQKVCWEKDYFTSARPWTQKGAAVNVPLGGQATVRTTSADLVNSGSPPMLKMRQSSDNAYPPASSALNTAASGGIGISASGAAVTAGLYPSNLFADLSTGVAAINDLREAFALQRFAEARARYGSRYTEYLRYLGVAGADNRIDRPEYLGGGRQVIQFSEVLQTGTDYNANTGVGNLKGHGIGAMRSNRYRRFFNEHGYVISLMSVLPKTVYFQGLSKMWRRSTNEDYYQRELESIGQAEVYNREIYAGHTSPNSIFGYQDRYDEYRRIESSIAGEFKTTLNYWHMAREFGSEPALNASFVSANPTKRMLASQSTDGLYVMVSHSIQARRLVGKGGTPK